MKTITTREFFDSPALVKSLRPGQSLLVTDNGEPDLVVTKAGKRAIKTLEDLRREASDLCSRKRPKSNFTAWLKAHRRR
jgi:hypothetical protein